MVRCSFAHFRCVRVHNQALTKRGYGERNHYATVIRGKPSDFPRCRRHRGPHAPGHQQTAFSGQMCDLLHRIRVPVQAVQTSSGRRSRRGNMLLAALYADPQRQSGSGA